MFTPISKFCSQGRENHSIVTELEGTLLISKNQFPYFMLVAFEAGGPIRSLILLLIYPVSWVLNILGLDGVSLKIMIFVAVAGIKVANIKAAAKVVLSRFYMEDVEENVYRVLSSCKGKKIVMSRSPKMMVDTFLKEYMDVDSVIGTELRTLGGYCLGLAITPGPIAKALQSTFKGGEKEIDVGLVNGLKDHSFVFFCRDVYFIPKGKKASPLSKKKYPKPLIFHDGRFVAKPTPLDCIEIFLWLPFAIFLAISRILVGILLPYKFGLLAAAVTGLRIRAAFSPTSPSHASDSEHSTCQAVGTKNEMGTLYVCSHRTLMDPVVVGSTLQRPVTAVTYSISRVSEILSPIRTVRLNRDRMKDGEMMQALLREGDLVVCPEGTTCREPYLLRLSPLFAEITNDIVPVAIAVNASMFHGTTVRGYKWLDPFFFLMNPSPSYHLQFLDRLPKPMGRMAQGQSSCDIANYVQQTMARALGYECTRFTRRDKYRILAGNDGGNP